MSNQIKIINRNELIQFIENTDLSLDAYRKIIDSYSGSKFFMTFRVGHKEFTQQDKENLILLIESKTDSIENGFPLFFALGE